MTEREDVTLARIHVAVIGCGYWGRNLVRNFAELGVLAAISDPDPDVADRISHQYGVSSKPLDAIVRDPEIEAVVIAAPAATHYQLTRHALTERKEVFVEKPLSLSVAEAAELCELAEKQARTLMVGHLLRYHPAFERLSALVEDGALGKLQYAYSNRLNLGRFRQEEDILWSFAPHDISMILSLIGSEPDEVRTIGSSYLTSKIADVTTTHLSFPGGERAHVYVSWLHPYKEQKLVVIGDEGMAVFDDGQPWETKLCIYPHHVSWHKGVPEPVEGEVEAVVLESREPLRAECEHFLECIRFRRRPRTDGWEGLSVLKVLDKAARSMVG